MTAHRTGHERGAVSVLVVMMVAALFATTGLAYDGGRILAARREAIDVASAAARAGAQQLDLTQLRAGNVVIDPDAARQSALDYLTATGHAGTATVTGDHVRVTVTITRDLAILAAVGMTNRTVTGTGTARPVRGIR